VGRGGHLNDHHDGATVFSIGSLKHLGLAQGLCIKREQLRAKVIEADFTNSSYVKI
jgi:hypothetical protein